MWTQEELEEGARDQELDIAYLELDSLVSYGITWRLDGGGGNIVCAVVSHNDSDIADIFVSDYDPSYPHFVVFWQGLRDEVTVGVSVLVDLDNLAGLLLTLISRRP